MSQSWSRVIFLPIGGGHYIFQLVLSQWWYNQNYTAYLALTDLYGVTYLEKVASALYFCIHRYIRTQQSFAWMTAAENGTTTLPSEQKWAAQVRGCMGTHLSKLWPHTGNYVNAKMLLRGWHSFVKLWYFIKQIYYYSALSYYGNTMYMNMRSTCFMHTLCALLIGWTMTASWKYSAPDIRVTGSRSHFLGNALIHN